MPKKQSSCLCAVQGHLRSCGLDPPQGQCRCPPSSATALGWVQRNRGVKCEPGSAGIQDTPVRQEPPESQVPGPEPGAQGIPTRGRRETLEAPGRRRSQRLGARNRAHSPPLGSGQRVGRGLKRPSGSPKFRVILSARRPASQWRAPQEGAFCAAPPPRHYTVEGSRAGLPPQLSLLPTRPLSAAPASAGCVPGTAPRPRPSPSCRAAAGCGSCAARAHASPVLPARPGPARPRLPAPPRADHGVRGRAAPRRAPAAGEAGARPGGLTSRRSWLAAGPPPAGPSPLLLLGRRRPRLPAAPAAPAAPPPEAERGRRAWEPWRARRRGTPSAGRRRRGPAAKRRRRRAKRD
ncbi:transcription initiation factor TFIID subunit 4-like [Lutra lutra]|uniref:transcription initiation factor TFIID subunit 4-like n=1 Tax=Lutra lutra TaxID=9657 RepID=UPI001FD5A610|nr:transcription initiation factor TFIID subunit 4-like [Lutra lutra]